MLLLCEENWLKLTNEIISRMISDLNLTVWVTSYCNVHFYKSNDWVGGRKCTVMGSLICFRRSPGSVMVHILTFMIPNKVFTWMQKSKEGKKLTFGDRQKIKSLITRIQKLPRLWNYTEFLDNSCWSSVNNNSDPQSYVFMQIFVRHGQSDSLADAGLSIAPKTILINVEHRFKGCFISTIGRWK